ncbi:MAG: hypothetical protein L0Z50_07690 [Verrucomicrobiales bacterium]|nr:hypothetical protein [Verrucomicrobiales bacterium]
MTPTLEIILLVVASIWGLACLVLLVALCHAASRPAPESTLPEPWEAKPRRKRRNRIHADELHSLPM